MSIRFEKYQSDALVAAFEKSEHLTKQKKIELGKDTGLDAEQINAWFNRKRASKRAKKSVGDLKRTNAEFQQAICVCEEREAKLQNELQECKRREAELVAEIHHLKQQLGIGGSDSHFDSVLTFSNGWWATDDQLWR